ncbi:histone-lysine N-methyltransferase SETMAR-like [Drosophila nasuta]|uniref:histone-lysine N-methyltransferase SETMAR-like n=1 Tax=Drosophila nasuta TaxID=42062 RepID=UPI00295EE0D4|nr:histone-lysine N-methyltransferase SETMAR-like [Drosophila nasuta]
MEKNKEKIPHILQYYYDKGKNAIHAANKICAVYGPDTVSISTARRWFQSLRSGAEVVEDEPPSGRPVVKNCDKLAELIKRDRHSSIGQDLGMSHQTVINHLKKLGFTKKFDVWVPHDLTYIIPLLPRSLDCNWRSRASNKGLTMPTTLTILISLKAEVYLPQPLVWTLGSLCFSRPCGAYPRPLASPADALYLRPGASSCSRNVLQKHTLPKPGLVHL